MTELPEPFRLRILTRCRVAGIKLVPGQVLHVSPDRLQVAAWLCSNGSAKPADATTATSIELFRLLR